MAEPIGVAQPALSLWLRCETEDNTTLRGCCAYRSRRYSGEDTPLESVRMTSAARFFRRWMSSWHPWFAGVPGYTDHGSRAPHGPVARCFTGTEHVTMSGGQLPVMFVPKIPEKAAARSLSVGLVIYSLWRRSTWQVVFASLAILSH